MDHLDSFQSNRLADRFHALVQVVLVFLILAAINYIGMRSYRRFDLTENRLFTLSEGTLNVIGELQEPVTLYFYFSEEASRDIPQLRSYAKRVDELLQEFVSKSSGKLTLRRVDPAPFSEEEDQAAAVQRRARVRAVA